MNMFDNDFSFVDGISKISDYHLFIKSSRDGEKRNEKEKSRSKVVDGLKHDRWTAPTQQHGPGHVSHFRPIAFVVVGWEERTAYR